MLLNLPIKTVAVCAFAAVVNLAQAQTLPPEVEAALARAKVPREALAAIVVDAAPPANGKGTPLLSYRATASVNPASVMKLVTTYAGLELLGPAYTWSTPVFVDGSINNGVLTGNLVIQGKGDPKLVLERLWLLLRRVQGLGIKTITGDILLDRSAFTVAPQSPADFDGEPLRPYNAAPDALLINFKSVVMTFVPNPGAGVAAVSFEPPLANVQMQPTVALIAGKTATTLAECGDYRAALQADFSDPFRISFKGNYPAGCGEKVWPIAYADPASYAERAIAGLWAEMGGKLGGRVRDGRAPTNAKPVFEMTSPSLAEVIRDINKFSNNVMAQQLFLTLSLPAKTAPRDNPAASIPVATLATSRGVVERWWRSTISADDVPVLDNGSGLSRSERISASALGKLLQSAYASAVMPELMSSLPISGVDGTLRARRPAARGTSHLKTGSLRDVTGVAGYVLASSGKRYAVVVIINQAAAPSARAAIDAVLDWAIKDN